MAQDKKKDENKKSDDNEFAGYAAALVLGLLAVLLAVMDLNPIIHDTTNQGATPLVFVIFFGALSAFGFIKPGAAVKLYRELAKIGDNWLKGSSNKLSTNGGTSTRDKSIDHSDIGGPANIVEGNNNSTGNTTTNNHYYYTPGTQPPGTETPAKDEKTEEWTDDDILSNAESKLRDIRNRRVSRFPTGQAPMGYTPDHYIMLHILPADGKPLPIKYIGKHMDEFAAIKKWCPEKESGDGVFSFRSGHTDSLIRFYRSEGFVEYVTRLAFFDDQKKAIESVYEWNMVNLTADILEVLEKMGVRAPILVMLSITGLEGYGLLYRPGVTSKSSIVSPNDPIFKIRRDDILPEGVVVPCYGVKNLAEIMKPMFNVMWEAVGGTESMNYDGDKFR